MTKNIDERVVEMQFNNKQFENGIRTSVKSLNDLKQGLKLDGAGRGLANLDKAAKAISFEGLARNVEGIASRFTNLGIIGVTALANISNAAINMGIGLVKSLTVDPISTGLNEYETKMNAIQTILTNTKSKGTTLDDVNKSLNELNEYSDKTIYNFAEMAKNIGTFTAAGVGLETSATAIKGIANLGAGSGSRPDQVASVMYQLSQALASGTVKLMDWNSVVNGGMGGELFQKALEKTAKGLGKGRNMAVSFRESLEDGWLTTDVLINTLNEFANDPALIQAATQVKTFTQMLDTMKESVQSGWAQTWEAIIGNKDQAAAFFTSVNDGFGAMIGKAAEARTEMFKFWNVNGGRADVIQGLTDTLNGLKSILIPIGEAFRDTFPAMTGQRLLEISAGFKNLMANFKIGPEASDELKRSFKGFFAVLHIGIQLLKTLAGGLAAVVKYVAPIGGSLLKVTARFGDFAVGLDNAIMKSGIFKVYLENIGKALKPIADKIRNTVTTIIEVFALLGDADTTGATEFTERIRARLSPLEKLGEIAKKIISAFYKAGQVISGVFIELENAILNSLNAQNFNSVFDMINSGLFAGILYAIKKFIDSLTGITSKFDGLLGGFTGILDGVRGSLEAYQATLKAKVLLDIAVALGILAAALFTLSIIDSDKLAASLGAMTVMFAELFGAMSVFGGITGTAGFIGMMKVGTMMIVLSTAILILSAAMRNLSTLDWKGVVRGLGAVAVLSFILLKVAKSMAGASGLLIKSGLSLILFAVAINILAKAVKKLGEMKPDELKHGLVGIGVLLTELALFMKATNLSKMGIIQTVGILIMAGALVVLAGAVRRIASIDPEALKRGLIGIGVMLAEIAIFTKSIGNPVGLMTTAISITILSGALLLLCKGLMMLAAVDPQALTRSLLTMAGALLAVGLAFRVMPNGIFIKSLALLDAAGAIMMLVSSIEKLGTMKPNELKQGLGAIAASIAIILASFKVLNASDMADSTAFTIFATGIMILAIALKMLGEIPAAGMAVALIGLATAFAIIGVAATFLTPLAPAILILAGAMALFGVGVALLGAGILALSTGLAALAVSGAAGAVALTALVSSIISLIPFALKTLAQGLIEFMKIMGDGAPLIAESFIKIVSAILTTISTVIPQAVEVFYTLIEQILGTIAQHIPQIVDSGMKIIIGFLTGIRNNIKEIVVVAIEIVINFINGITEMLPEVIQAGFEFIITFINGLAEAIRTNAPLLIEAMKNLVKAMLGAAIYLFTGYTPDFTKAGSDIIDGFITGIKSKLGEVIASAKQIGKNAIDAVKETLDSNSPSKEFEKLGMYSDQGLAGGLTKYASLVKTSADDVGKTAMSALSRAVSKISDIIDGDIDINPTIRPVLDLSAVNAGLSSTFSKTQGITVAGVTSNASSISKNIISANSQPNTSMQVSQNGIQTIKHTGKIIVEGVNSEGELVAVVEKTIGTVFKQGTRRIPNRVATIPNLA